MKIIKNKKYRILSLIAIFSLIFVFSTPVFAEPCTGVDKSGTPIPYGCEEGGGPGDPSKTPTGIGDRKPDYTGINITKPDSANVNNININTGIENPLGNSITDIPSFIKAILKFILYLGIPLVALAIIYTGFLFVTAMGNSEKLKKAKSALVYTLIGAALLLGAFVIAEAIQGTVEEISTGV